MEDGIDVIIQGLDPLPVAHIRAVIENPLFPVAVGDEFESLPAGIGLRLMPAFPNPFSTETQVAFELLNDAVVRVRIYDVRGRLVRDLAPGTLEAGPRILGWDGRDAFAVSTSIQAISLAITRRKHLSKFGRVRAIRERMRTGPNWCRA